MYSNQTTHGGTNRTWHATEAYGKVLFDILCVTEILISYKFAHIKSMTWYSRTADKASRWLTVNFWILQETILRCTLNVRVSLEEILKFVFFRKKIVYLIQSSVLFFCLEKRTYSKNKENCYHTIRLPYWSTRYRKLYLIERSFSFRRIICVPVLLRWPLARCYQSLVLSRRLEKYGYFQVFIRFSLNF